MRLIDGDALSEKFIKECAEECAICPMCDGRQYNNPKLLHCKIIIDAPIIDRPQGEWIRTGRTNIYGGIEVQCSNCNDKVMVQHLEDEWYCRHCGADMGMKGADDEVR